jgi:hypothetical protein
MFLRSQLSNDYQVLGKISVHSVCPRAHHKLDIVDDDVSNVIYVHRVTHRVQHFINLK